MVLEVFSFLTRISEHFLISTFTRTENTEKAIDLALQVLNRLHTTGISEKVLSSAKSYIKGQFPPNYETSGSLANLLTSMDYFGFDDRYINTFEETVDKMTVAKANEIAKKYFPKDNLQFVIIGKSSEIKDSCKEVWSTKFNSIIRKFLRGFYSITCLNFCKT